MPKDVYTQISGSAVPPTRGYTGDAGFDLAYSGEHELTISPNEVVDVPCHVRVVFPGNCWGLLIGRSSSFRSKKLLVNPAVIDSGYRGQLFAMATNVGDTVQTIKPGERVAQIVPLPNMIESMNMQIKLVDKLPPSQRGSNGFGSTGN